MKFIHLSDLHLGKRVNEFSMLEDQEYILKEILGIIDEEQPEGVILAGDIYDKTVPSGEAVALFDDFLVQLSKRSLKVFVISGNHDSPERLAFASRLIDDSGIHLSPVYDGAIQPFVMEDNYGPVNVYMLPFVKPANVRRYSEEEINTYTEALRFAVDRMEIDPAQRNLLITHQFITGATHHDSGEVSVGGTDNVDASVFEAFDYVALGHIHSPQNCGSERIRYCGTPLKYSFSEVRDRKSVTVVELGEKGKLEIRTVELRPRYDLVELRGTFEEVTQRAFYEGTTWQEDYIHMILTDEEDIPEATGKLRVHYHRLMKVDYDNKRTRSNGEIGSAMDVETRSPLELFGDFYDVQNNQPMSPEQADFIAKLIESIWEGEA